MTCIVAIIDGNCVVMGSDSAAVDEEGSIQVRAGPSKCWTQKIDREDFLVGFAGGFAEGSFIRHAFRWPDRKSKESHMEWLVKRVQPKLQKKLAERFSNRVESIDWQLIVAFKPGKIFTLLPCGDVAESESKFSAIGSGSCAALSCLETLDHERSASPSWEKIDLALKMAENFHWSVRSPFHVKVLV